MKEDEDDLCRRCDRRLYRDAVGVLRAVEDDGAECEPDTGYDHELREVRDEN